jgi:hypothetical protein
MDLEKVIRAGKGRGFQTDSLDPGPCVVHVLAVCRKIDDFFPQAHQSQFVTASNVS